jgi:hypothetical protein
MNSALEYEIDDNFGLTSLASSDVSSMGKLHPH